MARQLAALRTFVCLRSRSRQKSSAASKPSSPSPTACEARLAQAQTAVDRLTPSLLAKAFRGELVPQDPADEPAAELLKRLAASRTAPAAKARKPRQGQPA